MIGGIPQILGVTVPPAGPDYVTMARPSPMSFVSNPIRGATCALFALARYLKPGCEEIS
jgi:hypothetical protein